MRVFFNVTCAYDQGSAEQNQCGPEHRFILPVIRPTGCPSEPDTRQAAFSAQKLPHHRAFQASQYTGEFVCPANSTNSPPGSAQPKCRELPGHALCYPPHPEDMVKAQVSARQRLVRRQSLQYASPRHGRQSEENLRWAAGMVGMRYNTIASAMAFPWVPMA